MGWLIGAIFFGLTSITAISMTMSSRDPYEAAAAAIAIVITVFFAMKYVRTREQSPKTKEEIIAAEKLRIKKAASIPGSKGHKLKYGAINDLKARHAAGLPIAEGAMCHMYLCKDRVMFFRNETEYSLSFDKITDVLIKTDTEIQRAYVSSIGGAVGGAVLFGPLGAMVGGRTKKKETKTVAYYLIFSYQKDNGIEYISFEVADLQAGNVFVKAFSSREKAKKLVEL